MSYQTMQMSMRPETEKIMALKQNLGGNVTDTQTLDTMTDNTKMI